MLREGVLLGKRYEILSCIGSGGMADVYKGKDHKLNRLVAIKVLKSDYRSDEMFIKKFLSEAQAAAGLMHPNVVNVYDVGQDRGLYYMVMELVEGITLKEYIQRKGRLSPKETISISIQMVNGIQAAHNKNIVHRDIKPQNIIISKDGKVKVTDFGIARATTSTQTVSSSVMGSVHYTSPEHARGDVVNEQSDIYSAGITMYEMVTGQVPFDGDTTVTVALKHLQDQIISPAEAVPEIPYSLECIIMKCTAKNPARRYQNCQSLIEDLKRSLTDPHGDFVYAGGAALRSSDATVMMSTDELDNINIRRRGQQRPRRPDDYGPRKRYRDDYEDDYEDEDDNDYHDPDDAYRRKGDVDPNTQKISRILRVVVIIIIAIGVIAIGGWALTQCGGEPRDIIEDEPEIEQVEVPDLVGLTEDEARSVLNELELGFRVIERRESDDFEEGEIIEQEIAAGEEVDIHTTINVVVSIGPETVEVIVPDVIRAAEDDAIRTIEALNLVVGRITTEYHDTIPEGYVISTDPSAGARLEEGDSIAMVVSRGPEEVSVPDVRGISSSSARSSIENAGLRVGSISEEYSDSVSAGNVISQNIAHGDRVAPNTFIDLVISRGPEPVQMVSVPTLTGQSEAEARNRLTGAGLRVGNVTSQRDPAVMAGRVISQSHSSGSQVEEGTYVDFVVSEGPPDPPPPPPPDNDD